MNSNLVCVHLKVSIIVLTVKLPGSTLWQVTTFAFTRCSVYIEVKKKSCRNMKQFSNSILFQGRIHLLQNLTSSSPTFFVKV